MLPTEVLINAFRYLPRSDIEILVLVNRTFGAIVERDFAESPLRLIDVLILSGRVAPYLEFDIWNPQGDELSWRTELHQMGNRLKHCKVWDVKYVFLYFDANLLTTHYRSQW